LSLRSCNASAKATSSHRLLSYNFYHQLKRFVSMFEIFVTLVVPPVLIVVWNGMIIHSLFQYKTTFKGDDACSKQHKADTLTPLKTIQQKFNIQVSRYTRLSSDISYFQFHVMHRSCQRVLYKSRKGCAREGDQVAF